MYTRRSETSILGMVRRQMMTWCHPGIALAFRKAKNICERLCGSCANLRIRENMMVNWRAAKFLVSYCMGIITHHDFALVEATGAICSTSSWGAPCTTHHEANHYMLYDQYDRPGVDDESPSCSNHFPIGDGPIWYSIYARMIMRYYAHYMHINFIIWYIYIYIRIHPITQMIPGLFRSYTSLGPHKLTYLWGNTVWKLLVLTTIFRPWGSWTSACNKQPTEVYPPVN